MGVVHTRMVLLLVALLFQTGCMTDVEVFFAGRTEAGRDFLLVRQSDRLLGTRLRGKRRTYRLCAIP